jgi:hypothetical protein
MGRLKLSLRLGVVRYVGNVKKNTLLIIDKSSIKAVIWSGKPKFDDLPDS